MTVSEYSESKAKAKAKERDDYRCRFCGMTQEQHKEDYGRGLHAHHIIKDADGGADHPRNLITVCRGCHDTLEKTQADALSRIKQQHEERIEELRDEREGIFAWLENSSVQFHVLLKGTIDPNITTYTDRQKAAEKYAEHDGAAKLRSSQLNFADALRESFRFKSTAPVEINFNPNGDMHFEDGEQFDSDYRSADIPDELE